MRSMKKLLQKTLVFTLTAAMLIGTPMTSLAAPLNEVFQVTDRWGETSDQKGPDDTRTGTVTGSETNSGVLDADSKITGITLNETNVVINMSGAYNPAKPDTKELEVFIDWDGKVDETLEKALMKSFKWTTEDRDIVALKAMGKENDGKNNKMTLVAKAGGTTTVTVSLDSNEYNIHYSATAVVTVEQCASKLSFSDELAEDAYEGAVLKLDDYLVKEPVSATDKVTYVIKSQGKNTKATLKNGVLTLKLKKKFDQITDEAERKVTIVAIGKEVASADEEIIIKKAVPATKVEIKSATDGFTIARNKADWLINTLDNEVELGVTVSPEGCTDKVTWTSQKPAVVALTYNNPKDGKEGVTLTAKSVGTSKITAKAGKKSATLTVTVRANLTNVDITTSEDELYSGQTIQLTADQFFGANETSTEYRNFTDAGLNWVFDGGEGSKTDVNKRVAAMKKVATLNAKTGVLAIKPNLSVSGAADKVTVKVQNAKKIGKEGEPGYQKKAKAKDYDTITFDLKQINVTSIRVYSNLSMAKKIAGASLKNGAEGKPQDEKSMAGVKQNNTVDIANGTSRTYKVVVDATYEDGTTVDAATAAKAVGWTTNNAKLATVSANADGNGVVTAYKKGKATITIGSATKKGNGYTAIKATFKANVTVPTKSIALSVKNPGVAWKNGNQNIKITAKLDKGTTNKTSQIKWSVKKDGTKLGDDLIKGGTLKLKKGDYNVGEIYTVTAKLPATGLQTSITVKVVEPTAKVQIVQSEENKVIYPKNKTALYLEDETTLDLVAMVQKKGNDWVFAGSGNYADVTYTLKGDSVRLVGDTVYPVKVGKTTITAKTSDGKTTKLTVEVKAGSAPAAE